MGWDTKLAALWWGIAIPGGMLVVPAGHAASPLDEIESTAIDSLVESEIAKSKIPAPENQAIATLKSHSPPSPEQIGPIQFSSADRLSQVPQTDDRFLQPQPPPRPLPDEAVPLTPTPAPTPPEALPPQTSTEVFVQAIEVVGSTIFTPNDFAPIVAPIEGETVTLEQLQGVADQITQLYLDGGYITSRAVLTAQEVQAGMVQIQVIEGSLETIEVEGNQQVNTAYIRDRITLGGRTPLNQGRLEDQLRLLRLDPLFENVEASLRAGSGLGLSVLRVRVTEANPFFGQVSVDNYSPPSVGSERLGIAAGYRSPTGLGDEIYASYYRSTTGGSNVFDFYYRVPINPMNGAVLLRVSPSNYNITDPQFAVFDIEGNSTEYDLSIRQPLVRSPREEFALTLGFAYREGETLISDIEVDSSTTSVLRFEQDYIRRDPVGAWAARSQFNLGTGLLNASSGAEPDGQFFSWLGQLQRVQVLNPDNLLILQTDVQLTPDALLPSQQFIIGGGQSIRGYRQNARVGDNGIRLSVEDRIALMRDESGAPTLQVAPFADIGSVWNADNNPNTQPDQTFLASLGVGLLWNPLPRLNVRLDYGLPLVDLDDRGENAQDEGFYFSVGYRF